MSQPLPRTTARPVTAPPATPTLKRGRKNPKPRRMVFESGEYMAGKTLAGVLETYLLREANERPDIIVWCGNHPERRMIRDDVNKAAYAGWSVNNYRSDLRAASFERNGYRVDVRSSFPWFGSAADPATIHDAWYDLARWLRAGFGEWAYLWPTPTLTGQELLRGSLPFKHEYPTLPMALIELLLNVNLGGRTEVFTAPGHINGRAGFLPELYNLDMRWAYASCIRRLPCGPVDYEHRASRVKLSLSERGTGFGDVGYQPSFYKFVARVPRDWRHIGLLPSRDEGQTIYPHTPGAEFTGWATGAEVQLALIHGWELWGSRRITWPEMAAHDLAGEWIEKLCKQRKLVVRRADNGDRLAPLVAAALRNLAVHTVGSFNRVTRLSEGFTPYGAEGEMPTGALPLPTETGWQWKREVLQVDEWSHPEWFGTVTGRVRAKVAKMALQLPPETVVSIRTDGILTTKEPHVIDMGTPGSWRVKWRLPYAVPAPRDTSDVLSLIEQATNEYGANDTDHLETEGE